MNTELPELLKQIFYSPKDTGSLLKLASLYTECGNYRPARDFLLFVLSFERNPELRLAANRSILSLIERGYTDFSAPALTPTPIKYLLTMTTCKRLALFKRTVSSFFYYADYQLVDRVLVIDDGSSAEDIEQMKCALSEECDNFEIIEKPTEEKGHPQSLNLLLQKLRESPEPYFIHLEDDFEFFVSTPVIRLCAEVLHGNSNYGQCLFNNSYKEEKHEMAAGPWGAQKVTSSGSVFYEHVWPDSTSPHGYWAGFSLRPALNRIQMFVEVGDFIEIGSFEKDYSLRAAEAGWKTAYSETVCCEHIGRKTSERHDATKLNAYSLNSSQQFSNFVYSTKHIQNYIEEIEIRNEWSRLFLRDVKTLDTNFVKRQVAEVKLALELSLEFKRTQAFLVQEPDQRAVTHADWVRAYYELNGFISWDILYIVNGAQKVLAPGRPREEPIAWVLNYTGARKILAHTEEHGVAGGEKLYLTAFHTCINGN